MRGLLSEGPEDLKGEVIVAFVGYVGWKIESKTSCSAHCQLTDQRIRNTTQLDLQ